LPFGALVLISGITLLSVVFRKRSSEPIMQSTTVTNTADLGTAAPHVHVVQLDDSNCECSLEIESECIHLDRTLADSSTKGGQTPAIRMAWE
jgi:hypothetical protein